MIEQKENDINKFLEFCKKNNEFISTHDGIDTPLYEEPFWRAIDFLIPKINTPEKEETDKETLDGLVKLLSLTANCLKDMQTCSAKILAFDNASADEKTALEASVNSYLIGIYLKRLTTDQILKRFPSILQAIENPVDLSAFPEISESDKELLNCGASIQAEFIQLGKVWRSKFTDESPITENIPILQGIPSEKNYFVNCKAETQLKALSAAAAAMPDRPYTAPVAVANKGKVSQVCIDCTLSFDSENVKLAREITEYDRNVANAVASLYVAGKQIYGEKSDIILTPEMIFRKMNGITDQIDPSEKSVNEISESMDRLMHTFVKIDYSNEAKHRRLLTDKDDYCVIEGALISATKIAAISGGVRKAAYEIHKAPLLYRYASTVNKQIITFDSKLLDVRKIENGKPTSRIYNTKQNTEIKSYIVRRIEIMKGATDQSNRILYESIQETIGKPAPSNQEKKRIRDYTEQVLLYQQSIGNIKGFHKFNKGRSIVGVEIEF